MTEPCSCSVKCSRLLKLCSSLCCSQTPHLDPQECKDILLKKHDAGTCVLLQLSGLRCLHSSLTPPLPTHQLINDTSAGHNSDDLTPNLVPEMDTCFRTFSLKVANHLSQHLPTVYDFLFRYLGSSDQHICFCASKALVLVLLHTGVKANVITGIFTLLQSQLNTHVGVYCLQTVRELLKSLRKYLYTTATSKGELLQSSSECLQSVSENWLGILELLLIEMSGAGRRQNLNLTVGEFFSLTVELFRHKHIDISPPHKNGFLQCILTNLSRLLSLVKLCESVYILKRFIDVVLKSEEDSCVMQLHHFIIPSLTTLLGLPVCKEMTKCWLEECRNKLPIPVPITHTNKVFSECGLDQNGLIATYIRKTILFSLKCISRLYNSLSQHHPSSDIASLSQSSLKAVLTALCDLLLSVGLTCGSGDDSTQQYTAALYCVVSEDDGCLVHTLQASTSILTHTIQSSITDSIPSLKTFLAIVNPHCLWLHFFLGISFDHSVLLDLLLSPEINFSPVLHKYLQLVSSDWKNFEKITTSPHHTSSIECLPGSTPYIHSFSSYSQHHRTTAITSSLGDPAIIRDDCLSSPTPKSVKQQPTVDPTVTVLVDYSSSSSEDEETPPCSDRTASLNPSLSLDIAMASSMTSPRLSDHFPNNGTVGAPSTLASSVDTMLGQVMGCLIRLRMTLERLERSGLLPAHTASSAVITAIETTEKLFEDSAQHLIIDS